ncbi:MAG: RT0821/Lpp0805 family surface protein [Kiloniellales bacterium]
MRRVLIFILILVTDQSWMWVRPALALKDQRDATALFSALNDLMGFAAPGRSVVWENPETGNSGKITALRPTTVEGRSCWDFERTYEDNGIQAVQGAACEIEPGLWEIVREGQPRALAALESAPGVADAAQVREAQSLLRKLQYDPGPADGIYGQRTKRAVVAYQRDRGFEQSGAVTETVLDSLRQDVAALQPPSAPAGEATPPQPSEEALPWQTDQPSQPAEEELPWLKPKAEGGVVTVPPPPPAQ